MLHGISSIRLGVVSVVLPEGYTVLVVEDSELLVLSYQRVTLCWSCWCCLYRKGNTVSDFELLVLSY